MEMGNFSATSLRLTWSCMVKKISLDRSSILVIRLRNCHFQSFQFSSDTLLKNLCRFLNRRKLGGSSTSVAGWPGGSSSAENSNKSFCLVVDACANLGCASLKFKYFFLFVAIVFFYSFVFYSMYKNSCQVFSAKKSKIFLNCIYDGFLRVDF